MVNGKWEIEMLYLDYLFIRFVYLFVLFIRSVYLFCFFIRFVYYLEKYYIICVIFIFNI
jgi:hypothetical protein